MMNALKDALVNRLYLRVVGETISRKIHEWILNSSPPVRKFVDLLHGTWLGHPFHPVLTDATIGGWLFGSLFGIFSMIPGLRGLRRTAHRLHDLGTLSGIFTALSGIADYSAIKREAVAEGTLHAGTNVVALVLHILSWRARRKDNQQGSLLLALLGTTVATAGAWLGGELVYRLGVGVNHNPSNGGPEKWSDVASNTDLKENIPLRVEVDDEPILLYRHNGQIYAMGAVCTHAGGPLEEGKFDGLCVQCPWHDSVFDLRDGSIVYGPTVFPEPIYEVSVYRQRIRVRRLPQGHTTAIDTERQEITEQPVPTSSHQAQ
jgi:nitrite reductase/ring-hydroxylating ferredoxin subunit/uncharacterized membrane protein